MKVENFNAGNFVNQGDFNAFIPNPIGKDWTWEDAELNYLLAEANRELGGLNTYSELIPNVDVYINMHIQSEANKSNIIEGTKTTIEEDIMSLEDLTPEKRNDAIEVRNYIKALNYGVERITNDNFPLSTRLIKEIHQILMAGVRGEKKTPGEFRKSQNWIGGSKPSDAVFVPPPVHCINDTLSDLEKFIHSQERLPDILKVAIIHYQFETIHPFLDGNGRIGRIIVPLYLLSKKQLDKPCFYISHYLERNRLQYYNKLNNVRVVNDLLGWIKFFLQAVITTAKEAKEKFKKVMNVVDSYNSYFIGCRFAKSAKKVIETMYQSPVINITDLQRLTRLPNTTIFRIMRNLVEDRIVAEITGYGRNRVFILYKYLEVFK
jgi:Fic family protein